MVHNLKHSLNSMTRVPVKRGVFKQSIKFTMSAGTACVACVVVKLLPE